MLPLMNSDFRTLVPNGPERGHFPWPDGMATPLVRPAESADGANPTVIALFPSSRSEVQHAASLVAAPAADLTLCVRRTLQLDALVGHGPALAQLFQRMQAAARVERLTVLLTGRSGSGKSLVARTLHDNGLRARGPFVEVNCAAIPRDLFEVEFFGSSRNAYTQAADRAGRFAAAEGGTLFLDEVGEIPLDQQAKLLRVLDQGGRYERVGEDRTRLANVRLIAATNRDLEAAVSEGAFRADLYYRLKRFPIRVPSLDERREDIPELAQHLVARECDALCLEPMTLSTGALRALESRSWPGNVRELESVIAQAVIEACSQDCRELESRHIAPEEPRPSAPERGTLRAHRRSDARAPVELTFAEATRQFQRELLTRILDEEDWNVARTARRLGLARSHVYTLIDAFALARPGGKVSAR
jgi:Nif-specific regulatory protein